MLLFYLPSDYCSPDSKEKYVLEAIYKLENYVTLPPVNCVNSVNLSFRSSQVRIPGHPAT